MNKIEISFSALCVIVLVVNIIHRGGIQIAVWTPLFSHLYHILFGEGSIQNGDPWYDSYEVVVVAEVIILRLLTAYYIPTVRGLSFGAIALLLLIWVDNSPLRGVGFLYSRVAFGVDIVLVAAHYKYIRN